LALAAAAPGRAQAEWRDRFDVVVIDAGHGGEDHGARGSGGLSEKEVALDVTLRLAERLRERGLAVVLTREGDVFVPLEGRTAVANDARGDLFISIHANAARSNSPRGIETYFVSLEASDEDAGRLAAQENDAFGAGSSTPIGDDPFLALLGDMIASEHLRESDEFAKLAQVELARIDSAPSRGVKP
jgi:N-acetylmuramoyl-L-alanine amidase